MVLSHCFQETGQSFNKITAFTKAFSESGEYASQTAGIYIKSPLIWKIWLRQAVHASHRHPISILFLNL